MSITLTADQQAAFEQFSAFICDPQETVFVLAGFSGTGKTTLVKELLHNLPKLFQMLRLINPKDQRLWSVQLTATTNKAAEAFREITHEHVQTIQSFLKLRVVKEHKTGQSKLMPSGQARMIEDTLIFIDEASYVDRDLLGWIFQYTRNCKIVFIGDPAQLAPVNSRQTPVFEANFNGAKLTQVVRQAEGNPIIQLSTLFRKTVETGEWFSFEPDGHYIQHLDRDTFDTTLLAEFADPAWQHDRSKVLAWTNKCVVAYNQAIRDALQGQPEFRIGDYAICNSFVKNASTAIRTDQTVYISGISEAYIGAYGVPGRDFELNHQSVFFMPDHLADKAQALKRARAEDDYALMEEISERWIDLRAAYACTINKAQGSTYDSVFIDLDDLKRCRNGNTLARLLYVGVSRARRHVYFTGDLV